MEPATRGSAALADAYARMASDYRDLWAPTLIPYSRSLLDRLSLGSARRVLDLGAGVGALVPELRSRTGATLVVTDRAFGMLRLADAPARTVLDAAQLPFRDDVFDAVVMAFMLFHVAEPGRALEEVRRVLTQGGVAGTATWGAGNDSYPALELWNEALEAVAPDLDEDLPDSSEMTNTPEAMARLLGAAGFTSIETDEVPFENAFTPDSFLKNRLKIGRSRRLVEALSNDVREALVADVRQKLSKLEPADLVDHDTVVFARALAP
jgi:ubiquinone/menaquinone biosynthesis C-methylase UbiE